LFAVLNTALANIVHQGKMAYSSMDRSQSHTMSTSNIDTLLSPYEGPNGAHKSFRKEFKVLNGLYYLIFSAKDVLREHLKHTMANAEASAAKLGKGATYALGVVTHAISGAQSQITSVPEGDLKEMVNDFDGFIDLLNRYCIIAAHRAFVDFEHNLLIELDQHSLTNLSPLDKNDLYKRRLQTDRLFRQFKKAGEPIHTNMNELHRLRILIETRNVLEHNDGRATKKYIQLIGNASFSEGDPVRITSKEVAETFGLIETTVASLNQRVLKRFNL
jgi:hypothetical protein